MLLGGLLGDEESLRGGPVGDPFGEQQQDLVLAWGQ
jgi:hypothetical protein